MDFHDEFTNFVTSSNVRMKEKENVKELHFKIKFHFILFYIVHRLINWWKN